MPEWGYHRSVHVPFGYHAHHGHDHSGHSHAHGAATVGVKGGEYDTVPEGYTGTIYTCPMHAEVRHPGPGSCPICGMGLEPATVSAEDEGPNPELVDFTRRFWVGAVLTIPVLILAMGPFVGFTFFKELLGERTSLWLELVMSTPVILWSGWPFFVRGYHSFRTMNLNMFSLIGMGVGAAYVFSILAVVAPQIFPEGFRDENGNVGVYFEAAAVIVTLVLLGQVMELRAREGTGKAIRALLDSGVSPMTLRLFVLQAHYRKPLDFTAEALDAAASGWKGLNSALLVGERHSEVLGDDAKSAESSSELEEQRLRFITAMDDDLNSSGGLAVLFELARPLRALANRLDRGDAINNEDKRLQGQWQLLRELAAVLGLCAEKESEKTHDDADIQAAIEARLAAKASKNYAEADRIRDELSRKGIELIDRAGGITDWIRS